MKHLIDPKTIKMIIFILFLMLIVKIGWFSAEMIWLGAKGVEYTKPAAVKALYYRTRFSMQKLEQEGLDGHKQIVDDIQNIKLMAIYRSKEIVVITVEKEGKTTVLTRGDVIDGYVLDDATATEAIFLRDGKHYRIRLVESLAISKDSDMVRYYSDEKNESVPTKGIEQEGDVTVVDKTLLEHYTQNMDDIWKEIGINEVKEGGKISGFMVHFVKRGSAMAKLGLKKGDIIKAINGQELNSYQGAWDTFKDIGSAKDLSLTIKRGTKEMELNYAIE